MTDITTRFNSLRPQNPAGHISCDARGETAKHMTPGELRSARDRHLKKKHFDNKDEM